MNEIPLYLAGFKQWTWLLLIFIYQSTGELIKTLLISRLYCLVM
uniref:Uncharacterized protein n=1 Tax=Yersinia enterocolitica W22703 TaxID=913028 RepID=F4N403_YEREN|nr:unknown protein [Yersinia enterocolitica W22703]